MSGVAQQLATLVRSARRKVTHETVRFIGVRHDTRETLPEAIDIDSEHWRVYRVRSPLEARMALVDAGEEGRALLVAPLDGEDLGLEVLARLAKGKLLDFQPWQLVRDQFQAKRLDPRVVKEGAWMARELLACAPSGGYPPAPSGLLDLDTAWAALSPQLGLSGPRPGIEQILEGSVTGLATRWGGISLEFRAAVQRRLGVTAGIAGEQAVRAIDAGYGEDLVPIGWVLDLVLAEEVIGEPRALIVRTRLEQFGVHAEEPQLLRPWAVAAVRWLRAALESGEAGRRAAARALDRAEELVERLGARDLAEASGVLRSGLDSRTARLAEALIAAVGTGTFDQARAERAHARFREHLLVELDPTFAARRARALDALRLARWMARPSPELPSLGAHAARYRAEGAYVDRARHSIARGEGDRELAPVYSALVEAVARRREQENRDFADRLRLVTSGAEAAGETLAIEDVLERVVAPLAKELPVLLVVMDGMSESVAEELVEDLQRQARLQRMSPTEQERLPPMVGLLPSVTEVCRTSLLCGARRIGGQAEELEGFDAVAARHGWRGRATAQRILFHKAELEGTHRSVAKDVQSAIESSAKVVAVVVNAVDDQLSKGDQMRPDWKLDRVPILHELVQMAELAGRAIVLTSDHGHVVETGATRKSASPTGEGRWRPTGGALDVGEIEVRGERVLLPRAGGPCVVPWSEELRYSNPHAGYHGGASPQEVVTPLVVLVPEASSESIDGWKAEVHDLPWWWVGKEPGQPLPRVEPAPRTPTVPRKAARKEPLTPTMFPPAAGAPVAASVGRPAWMDRLFASSVWAEQRQLAGRTPPAEADVAEVLIALSGAGGKLSLEALRNRTRFTALRLRGLLTAMGRMLNVDGYSVFEVDHSAGEAGLSERLLFTQFGLGEEGRS
jgi:PglZ domain-containing protein